MAQDWFTEHAPKPSAPTPAPNWFTAHAPPSPPSPVARPTPSVSTPVLPQTRRFHESFEANRPTPAVGTSGVSLSRDPSSIRARADEFRAAQARLTGTPRDDERGPTSVARPEAAFPFTPAQIPATPDLLTPGAIRIAPETRTALEQLPLSGAKPEAPTREELAEPPAPMTFTEAFGRGVDVAQQLGYGALEATGELVGSRTLARIGGEGRRRNLTEADAGAKRSTFSDAMGGMSEFAQWAKETIG